MTQHLIGGLAQLLHPEAIGLLLAGMTIGMFAGMLPGMGVSLVLSLMLPFLYHMSVVPAVAMMLATQAGSYYAASITAILLNTPGAPESFPTTLDGFPMARRGEAGRALAISATSTWTGGWIGCVIMVALLQVAGQLIGLFHPPEFVAMIIVALLLIGGTGESTVSKVVLSGALGLMLSFIGSDPVTGIQRFAFGQASLMNGINVVPFALGVFALTQMVLMYGRNESVASARDAMLSGAFRRQVGRGIRDTAGGWMHVVRSGVVAAALGLIPGIGGFSANFISYSLGRQVSRKSGRFGTGVPAGVISAEGSSLAKEAGSLVPAVALGLPSGVGMVIFIAALTILGVQPGTALLRTQPALPYTMMWVLAIAGFVSCAVGLIITPWLSRVTSLRGPVMLPFIVSLAVLGSFTAVTAFSGVVELAVFAAFGVAMRKLGYSLAAMTIGLVLGGTFADNVHLTQSIYGWTFFTRSPLADVFLLVAVALIVLMTLRNRRHRTATSPSVSAAAGGVSRVGAHPLLEPAVDAVIAVFSVIYLVTALRYPPDAGRIPAVVAAIAAGVALLRLARRAVGAAASKGRRAPATTAPGGTGLTLTASPAAIPATATRPGQSRSAAPDPAARDPAASGAVDPPAAAGGAPAGQSHTGPGGGDLAADGLAAGGQAAGGQEGEGRAGESRAGQGGAADGEAGDGQAGGTRRRTARELSALGWIFAVVAASYLLGFAIGVTVVIAAYCLTGMRWRRRWQKLLFTTGAAGTAFLIAVAFISLFHLTFFGLLL